MLARMNFASGLAGNQKFDLATAASAAAGAKASAQGATDFMLSRLTANVESDVYADLVTYASAGGAWTGSATQLQSKTSGLAHLILGSADYQVI
jgi:activator of HSP90 ATPase